jgi:hypothetical protein
VRGARDGRDIHKRTQRVGHGRAGDKFGLVREQGQQVFNMKSAVVAHLPPDELRAEALEREPGCDIGVVVEIRDDELVAIRLDGLGEGEADKADERRGIHAERHFRRIAGVDPCRDFFARGRDHPVDGATLFVASAPLDIDVEQMMRDGIENALRQLRAGGIVEIDKGLGAFERGKFRADNIDGKSGHRSLVQFANS